MFQLMLEQITVFHLVCLNFNNIISDLYELSGVALADPSNINESKR